MSRITRFVDVILPVPLPRLYTYRVPHEMTDDIQQGHRVVVQFGKNKLYTGIVHTVHETPPAAYQAKYLDAIMDELPVVTATQLKLWEWMATYYMCSLGEVMKAALPGGLKLASETRVVPNPESACYGENQDRSAVTDNEFLVVEALEVREVLSLQEIAEIIDRKTVYPIVKTLLEKGAVMVEEELKQRYKPRVVNYVRLTPEMQQEEALQEAFSHLEKKAPKQLKLLMSYIQLSKYFSGAVQEVKKIPLQQSVDADSAVVNQLVKKGIFEVYDKEEGRLPEEELDSQSAKGLSEAQQVAYTEIGQYFDDTDVVLLHGVTGSGKTEVYIQLIEDQLAQGKQVLYLLPEIALTTQIINRLKRYFGNRIGVYHSKFNLSERVEVWNDILHSTHRHYDIILGARSAALLPFQELGLIIVDEEHESSYKQFNPAPRYNARDTAMMLARFHGAKVLLGSATPSVEAYWNAQEGRFGLVELTKRYGNIQLPEVQVADVKEATRRREMKSHFSPFLLEHMKETLEKGEQIILFQNRRGFAPYIQCDTCAWIPECTRCDVSLTLHKHSQHLRCHYCGLTLQAPKACQACGDTNLKMKGFGTEKIEEEIPLYFPNARVARMDLDTTRAKNAYQRIINDFEDRVVDILVGTQMVTKGLDFDNVALVGILNADTMLYYPDYRAHERGYQLMAQVAGRAGRKNKRGKVIVQTYNPGHAIIQYVMRNDYNAMYTTQLLERRNFHYPPFYRLIRLTLQHRDVEQVNISAAYLAEQLRTLFPDRILGPEFPPVARIRNLYHKNLMIKIEREASIPKAKRYLQATLDDFKANASHKSVRVIIDVDPA